MKRALVLGFLSHTAIFFAVRFLGHWIIFLVYQRCGDVVPELHDHSSRSPGSIQAEVEERYEACMHGYLASKYTVFLFTICLFLYAGWRRGQIRRRYGLSGDVMRDYLAWIFCSPCALCQEARTVHNYRILAGSWLGPIQSTAVRPPPPQFMHVPHATLAASGPAVEPQPAEPTSAAAG